MAVNTQLIFTQWNVDEFGNKISIEKTNEPHQVVNGQVLLNEIPDAYRRVTITGMNEINIKSQITSTNQFKVNYELGLVYFHASKEGTSINFNYWGRGNVYIDVSRIATKSDGTVVTETLKKLVDLGQQSIEFYEQLKIDIANATDIDTQLKTSISTATSKKTELDESIGNSILKKSELDNSIADSVIKKTALDESATNSVTKKGELDNSIADSVLKKQSLDDSIADSIIKKTALDGSITESVAKKQEIDQSNTTAATAKTDLTGLIGNGTTLKGELNILKTDLTNAKKAYDDAVKANLSVEVSNARTNGIEGKSYVNLQERLDKEKQEITSQLAENASQSLVTELPINTLSNAQDGIMQVESIKGKTLQNLCILRESKTWNTPTNRFLSTLYKGTGLVGLKANVKHTLLMYISNLKGTDLTVNLEIYYSDSTTVTIVLVEKITKNGVFISSFTPTKDLDKIVIKGNTGQYLDNGTGNSVTISDIMILEGDHTLNPPPYFEGIISTGVGNSDIKTIITDLTGKIAGSSVTNPNISKHNNGTTINNTALYVPSSFPAEIVQSWYDNLFNLDTKISRVMVEVNGGIPQQLFSWNLIEIIERKIGSIGATLAEKVAWLKSNLSKIICNWYGYSNSPLGSKGYLSKFDPTTNQWGATAFNISTVPSLIQTYGTATYTITDDGFAHFIAYTDPSDGATPSVINTDYVNLVLEFKAWQRPKEDKENNKIEILTQGRNWLSSTLELGSFSFATGDSIVANDVIRSKDFIKVKGNTQWVIESERKVPDDICYVFEYDINKNFLGYINKSTSNKFTTKPNTAYIKTRSQVNGTGSYTLPSQGVNLKIQLEEGTVATAYEPYKSDKLEILLPSPHRGLPNGVSDEIFYNLNKRIKRVGKVALNGSEFWHIHNDSLTNVISFSTSVPTIKNSANMLSDKFIYLPANEDVEHFRSTVDGIVIFISRSKLATQDVAGFKAWLQANPTTVYYELAVPIEETLNLSTLKSFKGGSIQLNNAITPVVSLKYPSNITSRLSGVETELDKLSTDHLNTLKALLIVADKEAKMKTITLLATETTLDIKNKINEILNIWR